MALVLFTLTSCDPAPPPVAPAPLPIPFLLLSRVDSIAEGPAVVYISADDLRTLTGGAPVEPYEPEAHYDLVKTSIRYQPVDPRKPELGGIAVRPTCTKACEREGKWYLCDCPPMVIPEPQPDPDNGRDIVPVRPPHCVIIGSRCQDLRCGGNCGMRIISHPLGMAWLACRCTEG